MSSRLFLCNCAEHSFWFLCSAHRGVKQGLHSLSLIFFLRVVNYSPVMVMRAATATKWSWQQWHRPSNLFLSSASPPRKEPGTRERPFSPISNRSLTRFSSYCCLSPKDPIVGTSSDPILLDQEFCWEGQMKHSPQDQRINEETKEVMNTWKQIEKGEGKGHFSQRIFGSFVCFCCFLKTNLKKKKNTEEPTNAT